MKRVERWVVYAILKYFETKVDFLAKSDQKSFKAMIPKVYIIGGKTVIQLLEILLHCGGGDVITKFKKW